MNHFYYGSQINNINVSGKTVQEANGLLASELSSYTMNLKLRGGKNEQIRASDIGLKYTSDGEVLDFKDRQNAFKWISAFFSAKNSKMTEEVSYDKKLLKERLYKSSFFDSKNIIEPKNPTFEYTDKGYVIVPEVLGNKVNEDILYNYVSSAILKDETTTDLEAIKCYVNPQYTSNSQKIIDVKNMLNKYALSKITYTFGSNKEVLDGSTINKWLKVDDKFSVTFDEGKVKTYVSTLSSNYNTVGKARSFKTTSGQTINVNGGDYGWSINTAKETEALIKSIKEGQIITKEPTYSQTALSHESGDIGNSYVEIDMGRQHLWFYKNGTLIAEGNVVTGNIRDHATPAGVFKLKYKEKNATLKGPGYEAPVTYWMPFNNGIGMHDASWRGEFGGNIYKSNGSHGCVNQPINLAKTIFDNIQVGTPVVCFY